MIYESLMQQTKVKFDIAAFASLEKFTFYSKLDIKVPKYLLVFDAEEGQHFGMALGIPKKLQCYKVMQSLW